MKLDLTDLVLTPGKKSEYIIDEPGLGEIESGTDCTSAIKGSLHLANSYGKICLSGHFETVISIMCGRCLEYYSKPIIVDIDEVFPLNGDVSDENYIDDTEFPLFADNILNLTELLRQYILVEIPLQPLCSAECKGFCQGCGVNLNKSECKCTESYTDNPFSRLLDDCRK